MMPRCGGLCRASMTAVAELSVAGSRKPPGMITNGTMQLKGHLLQRCCRYGTSCSLSKMEGRFGYTPNTPAQSSGLTLKSRRRTTKFRGLAKVGQVDQAPTSISSKSVTRSNCVLTRQTNIHKGNIHKGKEERRESRARSDRKCQRAFRSRGNMLSAVAATVLDGRCHDLLVSDVMTFLSTDDNRVTVHILINR